MGIHAERDRDSEMVTDTQGQRQGEEKGMIEREEGQRGKDGWRQGKRWPERQRATNTGDGDIDRNRTET